MSARFLRTSMLLAMALGALALVTLPSCEDNETPHECTDVPAGGCPLSRGVACQDPACEAVYACRPGNVWELDHTCPPREAGARDASTDVANDVPIIAFDANIDAPPGANGGPGCESLQAPDCALGLVLACSSGCCGCEDLFVCENNGWTYYSTCK